MRSGEESPKRSPEELTEGFRKSLEDVLVWGFSVKTRLHKRRGFTYGVSNFEFEIEFFSNLRYKVIVERKNSSLPAGESNEIDGCVEYVGGKPNFERLFYYIAAEAGRMYKAREN